MVAAEAWLAGEWSGIAVHGQTDLILGLPGDRLLVVDYKRSKFAEATQADAEGVRQPGEPVPGDDREWRTEGSEEDGARGAAQGAAETGVVYYLLNDQVALSDTVLPGAAAVPGWRVVERRHRRARRSRGSGSASRRCAPGSSRSIGRAIGSSSRRRRASRRTHSITSPLIGLFALPDQDADDEEAEAS